MEQVLSAAAVRARGGASFVGLFPAGILTLNIDQLSFWHSGMQYFAEQVHALLAECSECL